MAPLEAPYPPDIDAQLSKMMPPGVAPIALFRMFVRNLPMTEAMHPWGSYELSGRLSLSMRDREIVIDRTCARCGCEYEWSIHVGYFAGRVHLDRDQVASLTAGNADDTCWTDERDRVLIRAVDSLHDKNDISDDLWKAMATLFSDANLLDLLLLCGWYHAISFVARAARLPLEPESPTFASLTNQYQETPGAGTTRQPAGPVRWSSHVGRD